MQNEPNDELLPEEDNQTTADVSPEETPERREKPSFWAECYTYLHDLVYILTFLTLFFVFVLRVVSVSGYSMYPTLVDRDYVALLSNVFYHGDSVENGDVVVALAPNFDSEPIVKRVIATAGQTVDIDFEQGVVYVDGVALDEPYINEPTYTQYYERGVRFPLTIEEGHVFLMGDNRNDSSDSRMALIGQVDTRYILGEVVCVIFPGADKFTNNDRDFGRIGGVS